MTKRARFRRERVTLYRRENKVAPVGLIGIAVIHAHVTLSEHTRGKYRNVNLRFASRTREYLRRVCATCVHIYVT